MAALRGRVGTVVVLALVGCFGEPPEGNSTGSDDESGGESTTDDPTTTVASAGTGTSDSETGTVETESSGTPCVPEDPECAGPGETIWEASFGGEGHDAVYKLIVDDDGNVVVAGEHAGENGSDPWFARFDADGNEEWSNPTILGGTVDALRGLALMGDGVVLGVGSRGSDGYFELRNAGGATVSSTTYPGDANDLLINVLRFDNALITVGFVQTMETMEPTPLLLRHTIEGDALQLDYSSFDSGAFVDVEGQFFEAALAPNGNVVVVGSLRGDDGTYDGGIQMFTPEGDVLSEPVTIGGAAFEDLYMVDVDGSGSGIAVGRAMSETSSEILIAHFSVADNTPNVEWNYAWTEAPFTYANGFARDGDTVFIATGTTTAPGDGEAYDARIIRWDGRATEPTWAVPFAADSPHRDYASDVDLAPDGTLVACGVHVTNDSDQGDGWVRKLAR